MDGGYLQQRTAAAPSPELHGLQGRHRPMYYGVMKSRQPDALCRTAGGHEPTGQSLRCARSCPRGEPGAERGEDGVASRVPEVVVDPLEVVGVGNARVRGFLDWCDDEPGRLPIVGGGSGERVPPAIKHWASQMKIRILATWWMRESRDSS